MDWITEHHETINEGNVAILADLHSNAEALKAILNDMPEKTKIYHAGDFLAIGPRPKECLKIFENHNIKSIKGNHDDSVLAAAGLAEPYLKDHETNEELKHHAWCAKKLTTKELETIKNWPYQITVTTPKKRIAIIHWAAGQKPGTYKDLNYKISQQWCQKNFKNIDADTIVFGHSHKNQTIESTKTYINLGSSGVSKTDKVNWLLYNTETNKLEQKETKYSAKTVIDRLKKQRPPALGFILDAFFPGDCLKPNWKAWNKTWPCQ